MATHDLGTAELLVELGFTQYEARAYVGLLGAEPMTGYALANSTGIPQPKVYETLRRLTRMGAVVPIEGEPARYVPVPPVQLLAQLETSFHRRLSDAQIGLMPVAGEADGKYQVLSAMSQWSEIEQQSVELIGAARRHIYLSLNCSNPVAVLTAIEAADQRGVRSDILHFGSAAVPITNGRCLRHVSTDGVVYRHHQARHVGIVADGSQVLWALAPHGDQWDAVRADNPLIAAAVKGYIRHDMYVQQIVTDFGDVLVDRYGPGLEGLVMAETPPAAKASKPPRKAGRRKLSA
jgi:HTH-type transcriptional regulator, sugar sensing transcriptional regulator